MMAGGATPVLGRTPDSYPSGGALVARWEKMMGMRISTVGTNLPGRMFCRPDGTAMNDVHVGIQRRRDPVELVGADAAEVRWDVIVDVVERKGSIDFRGPEVQGKLGERFIYLTWGEVGPVHRADPTAW